MPSVELFELSRCAYTAAPDRMDKLALYATFPEHHTTRLFEKHGMTNVGDCDGGVRWPHRSRRSSTSRRVSGMSSRPAPKHHLKAFRSIPPRVHQSDWRSDTPRAADTHDARQRIAAPTGGVQHSQLGAGVSHQQGLHPGEEVPQGTIDAGIYAHQVRVTPDGRHVVLVTRGNEGTAQRPRTPAR